MRTRKFKRWISSVDGRRSGRDEARWSYRVTVMSLVITTGETTVLNPDHDGRCCYSYTHDPEIHM